jgi:hypothetical protein
MSDAPQFDTLKRHAEFARRLGEAMRHDRQFIMLSKLAARTEEPTEQLAAVAAMSARMYVLAEAIDPVAAAELRAEGAKAWSEAR